MERVNRILQNQSYREYYAKIEKAEADRRFCLHNISHFLDVARIAMLLNLQENLQIEQELIYTTAILHDIGRFEEYQNGTSHEKASVILAEEILKETGFTSQERMEILSAINCHRDKTESLKHPLSDIIYRADKLSRNCFFCSSGETCNWKQDKKNRHLTI